jgi:UDP:flavonoid glycosyltransferase YjiC (YdhE family)
MEAMDHGVPMLLVPICNDQPVQAMFLERAAAGLGIDPADVDEASAREALAALLDHGQPYRRNAWRVRDSYRAHDGARETARLIAGLTG